MLKKKLILLGGLTAATTIPIAASKDGFPAIKEKIQSVFQGDKGGNADQLDPSAVNGLVDGRAP